MKVEDMGAADWELQFQLLIESGEAQIRMSGPIVIMEREKSMKYQVYSRKC